MTFHRSGYFKERAAAFKLGYCRHGRVRTHTDIRSPSLSPSTRLSPTQPLSARPPLTAPVLSPHRAEILRCRTARSGGEGRDVRRGGARGSVVTGACVHAWNGGRGWRSRERVHGRGGGFAPGARAARPRRGRRARRSTAPCRPPAPARGSKGTRAACMMTESARPGRSREMTQEFWLGPARWPPSHLGHVLTRALARARPLASESPGTFTDTGTGSGPPAGLRVTWDMH